MFPAPGWQRRCSPFKLPSMAKGGGLAFGYNFHPNFALEGDIGLNLKDQFDVSTYSIGPRFTWRGEGMNLFVHTLLGDNHLTAPSGAEWTGRILGGGIDLPIGKRISLRLIEADYQWARQNYASVVPASQPDLRRTASKVLACVPAWSSILAASLKCRPQQPARSIMPKSCRASQSLLRLHQQFQSQAHSELRVERERRNGQR